MIHFPPKYNWLGNIVYYFNILKNIIIIIKVCCKVLQNSLLMLVNGKFFFFFFFFYIIKICSFFVNDGCWDCVHQLKSCLGHKLVRARSESKEFSHSTPDQDHCIWPLHSVIHTNTKNSYDNTHAGRPREAIGTIMVHGLHIARLVFWGKLHHQIVPTTLYFALVYG